MKLKPETQRLFVSLVSSYAAHLPQIEQLRETLAKMPRFTPCGVFQSMAAKGGVQVDSLGLQQFLIGQGLQISEAEANLVVKQFDQN